MVEMSSILHNGDDSHQSNSDTRPNGIHLNGDANGVNGHWKETASESFTEQPGFPIAIIGMSCKLPGDATNPEKLWELCAQGRDAWSEIPQSRFNSTAFYDSEHERTGMVRLPTYGLRIVANNESFRSQLLKVRTS